MMLNAAERIRAAIRDVPGFPKPGIIFKDITPVLLAPALLRLAIGLFCDRAIAVGADKIAGIDARGFIFAGAVSERLGLGMIPIRKSGKLPCATYDVAYDLEYGSATLAMHQDAVMAGERILILDDLLATGGTANAAVQLVERAGGVVAEVDVLVELAFLNGRAKLAGHTLYAITAF